MGVVLMLCSKSFLKTYFQPDLFQHEVVSGASHRHGSPRSPSRVSGMRQGPVRPVEAHADGQYRRRVKIPKEKVVGADGKTVVVGSTPTKGSSDIEVSPTSSPDLKSTTATPMPTTPTVNNNNVGKKNVVSGSVDSNKSKNKRKSSPPVKVKMSFNFAKSGKKQRSGKS